MARRRTTMMNRCDLTPTRRGKEICRSLHVPDCGKITTQLGTPRARYDEHNSKFSLSKKPRFIEPVGKRQTSEGDAC
jgi:hypothetical protein